MFKFESRNCPMCNSNSKTDLNIDGDKEKVGFNVICKDCGLIYHNPVPSISSLEDYYAKEFSKEYHESDDMQATLANNRFSFLEKFIDISLIKTSFEIGSSYGDFVKVLNDKGIDSFGIEPSKELSNIASNTRNVKSINTTFENFEIDFNFDLVCGFHVLEHFYDPLGVLLRLGSILKKNGYLYIEVPTIEIPQLAQVFKIIHPTVFHKNTIISLLQISGFKIEKIELISSNIRIIAKNIKIFSELENSFDCVIRDAENYIYQRRKLIENINKVISKIPNNEALYIYGAGHNTYDLFENTDLNSKNIQYIVDKDKNKIGNIIFGYSVMEIDYLRKIKNGTIVISTFAFQDEVYSFLTNLKLKNVSILKIY